MSSLREYGLNHPLEEVPPAFFIWKYVNKVVTLVIIITCISLIILTYRIISWVVM